MEISLYSPAKKALFLGGCGLLASAYIALSASRFLAAHFSNKPDPSGLQEAIRLSPGNAEYRYRLGHYELWAQPTLALPLLESAVGLNSHPARYWMDLSIAYQILRQRDRQKEALTRAVASDPKNPDVAWDAANIYWAQGDTSKALSEFGRVMEGDPYLLSAALERCWQINPDAGHLLQQVMPRNSEAYSSFLNLLIVRKETSAAQQVWAQMVQLQQPVERRYVLDYANYLVGQREVAQAGSVWQQAAGLSDLSAYQPTSENLVVNGDFSLPVLNGGFDWLYEKSQDVTLTLDPVAAPAGHNSLSIVFDSRGLEDAGIRQLVQVLPNTRYDFSALFKTEAMQGAGGPRFVIQDAYSNTLWFASDELKDADSWKQIDGSLTTGPNTDLVVLRIQRFPAGNAIRGHLWIDEVRLTEHRSARGSE